MLRPVCSWLSINLLVYIFFVAQATCNSVAKLSWAYEPDHTYQYYRSHGIRIPQPANHINEVTAGSSYVIMLNCYNHDMWEPFGRAEALLLNFTLSADRQQLHLNSKGISPLGPLPVYISAFQTPMNLSARNMARIIEYRMLYNSKVLSTKYKSFNLSFDHAVLATKDPTIEIIQFDVKTLDRGRDISKMHIQDEVRLNAPGQVLVQITLQKDSQQTPILTIQNVELVDRATAQQREAELLCGSASQAPCPVHTFFRNRDYDSYGRVGSIHHQWRWLLEEPGAFLLGSAPALAILAVPILVAVAMRRRIQRRTAVMISMSAMRMPLFRPVSRTQNEQLSDKA